MTTLFTLSHELFRLVAAQSANGACREPNFFGLVPWYHYLNVDQTCNIKDFTILPTSGTGDIPLILLAVVDDLLRLAGLIAVGFVIYGGIKYITSQGEPEKTANAQSTIINALIGLAVAIIAVSAVTYIGGRLGAN